MTADNANGLFADALYYLRDCPTVSTRHGKAKATTKPTVWTVRRPWERVLYHPSRKANPYFHVMETVWMFAGRNKVDWLLQFNSGMEQYADDGVVNGAYGHRWRNHFGRDQIFGVIRELKRDRDSRQAVIAMYDPAIDHDPNWRDRPCNTHIYFRVVGHHLDMTVCNRSNDLVWGMCGANIVHMTYLHELVSSALNIPMGHYHVMTNNLHIYEPHWHLFDSPLVYDQYKDQDLFGLPLLGENETDVMELLNECEQFVKYGDEITYKSNWLEKVVKPMYGHYQCRRNGDKDTYDVEETQADDWALAESKWREWHD